MKRLTVRQWKTLSIYALAACLAAALETGFAFILLSIARMASDHNLAALPQACILAAGFLIPLALADWTREYLNDRIAIDSSALMRGDLLKAQLGSTLPTDAEHLETESVQQSILVDAALAGDDLFGPLATMWYLICTMIAAMVGLFLISPPSVILALVMSTLPLILTRLARNTLQRHQEAFAAQTSTLTRLTSALARGLESVASTHGPFAFQRAIMRSIRDLAEAQRRRSEIRAIVSENIWHLGMLTIVATWVLGTFLTSHSVIALAQVVALAQLMMQVAGPMQSMGSYMSSIVSAYPQVVKLTRFTEQVSNATAGMSGQFSQTDSLRLDLEAVTIPGIVDTPISLHLNSGDRLLISGPSGVGKSTLMRAIAGLRPFSGAIHINGTPLEEYPSHLGLVALATQSAVLLPGNLCDNWPKDDSLLPSLLTPLESRPASEKVDRLSGGEQKRLHLSHALTTRPSVLLLDEITTGLDEAATAQTSREITQSSIPIVIMVTHHIPEPPENLGFSHHLSLTS